MSSKTIKEVLEELVRDTTNKLVLDNSDYVMIDESSLEIQEIINECIGEDEPVNFGDRQIGNIPEEDRNELRSLIRFNLEKRLK